MPQPYRHRTIKPSSGGRLITALSLENVGETHYSAKVNFRRYGDKEVRREGWRVFQPGATPAGLNAAGTITLMAELVRPNGDRAIVAFAGGTIYRYNHSLESWVVIGSGYDANGEWEAAPLNGYLVMNNGIDLMATFRVEDSAVSPIHELRERGIASVGTFAIYNGFLICADIRQFIDAEHTTWMNGVTPYGPVPDNLVNRFRYRVIWSEFGEPRNWAPIFTVTMASSSTTLTLPFPSQVFVANETRVAVVNGGPLAGVLGGQEGYETGILVTAVSGADVTLEIPTDAGLTYPRTVQILRFTDTSSITGYRDIQDDGSAIVRMKELKGILQLYRETGIFRGRYTGDVANPFTFAKVYGGPNVPVFRDCVADVRGEIHVYPSRNRFFSFDGIDEPRVFDHTDLSRNLFFNETGRAFAVDCPITREVWFCRGNGVLAFDYEQNTSSFFDATVGAAVAIENPADGEPWMLMASGGVVHQYGRTASWATFLRNGSPYESVLKSGLWALGDEFNEKDVRSYIVHLASGSPDATLVVTLRAARDQSNAPDLVADFPTTVDAPTTLNLISLMARDTYFQDEIKVTDTGDVDVQITSRTIEASRVGAKSVVRT